MGRRLRSQRLGAGRSVYRSAQSGIAEVNYINIDDAQKNGVIRGEIVEFFHDPARSGILAKIRFENNLEAYVIAAEGLVVGDSVETGSKAGLRIGNILPVGNVVEGCPVFNIEKNPGDGGEFARASGLYALVMTRDSSSVYVKMPSGKTLRVSPDCRATIGCAAGGGRPDKPFVKAGAKYWAMRARGKHYPKVRGVAMNPVDHPFGGSQHHVGKSKSTSRHAAPGRMVGAIASKRTGRRKR